MIGPVVRSWPRNTPGAQIRVQEVAQPHHQLPLPGSFPVPVMESIWRQTSWSLFVGLHHLHQPSQHVRLLELLLVHHHPSVTSRRRSPSMGSDLVGAHHHRQRHRVAPSTRKPSPRSRSRSDHIVLEVLHPQPGQVRIQLSRDLPRQRFANDSVSVRLLVLPMRLK